jgi:hypothetical protein
MPTLRKVAFLVEECPPQSPARQLLDRFLMGYSRDGTHHHPQLQKVSLYTTLAQKKPLRKHTRDFGLAIAPTVEAAIKDADAVVIVSRQAGTMANDRLLQATLTLAPRGARCFVYGTLSTSFDSGQALLKQAQSRDIALLAGTALSMTWRLPEIDLARDTPIREALIVVQTNRTLTLDPAPAAPSAYTAAELDAVEGLLPVIARRQGGESGIESIQLIEEDDIWRAGTKGQWSWPLLTAAISRSNSPLGDPMRDARTQDIVGLGLVPKLARHPRGWILRHRDGLRSALLVLDGVLNDFNFAVQTKAGPIISAQLLRPAPPRQHHFCRLTAAMEDYFRGGKAPWPVDRNLLIAGLMEAFRNPATRTGRRLATPGLDVSY